MVYLDRPNVNRDRFAVSLDSCVSSCSSPLSQTTQFRVSSSGARAVGHEVHNFAPEKPCCGLTKEPISSRHGWLLNDTTSRSHLAWRHEIVATFAQTARMTRVTAMPSGPRRQIGIVTPSSRLYLELSQILVDVFGDLEHDAITLTVGDPRTLRCDLLLVAGEGPQLAWLPQLLGNRVPARRPTTVFWQLEPLPPPSYGLRAEAQGRGLAQCDWDGLANGWLKPIRNFIPARNVFLSAVQQWRARPLRREMSNSGASEFDTLHPGAVHYVVTQAEWIIRNYGRGWIDHVFTSTLPRQHFLSSRGIPAGFAPVGYHDAWGYNLGQDRDVDVLFLGRYRKTRRRIRLERIRKQLAARDIRLVTVDRECFGSRRTALLNRTKVVLNLLKFPWDHPGMRMLAAMGCGAMVVSERCRDTAPYRDHEHFMAADPDELVDTIVHYVEHASERAEIARRAFDFVSQELTMRTVLSSIMDVVTQRDLTRTRSAA